ncbi:hypothetical protein E3O06_09425 [Cryobacterium glaciale]|uniref:Uncharacterized protein n=1 Tax=Cryobacterium glaciale TaxID=1259145 RepID=A0A4R8UUQ3_9MICO|nr:hypothetical protein [Cryobacterium glaciale]TFB72543.1 hypothetical protein E3O06_09425 [Cryobacterium glaciale]
MERARLLNFTSDLISARVLDDPADVPIVGAGIVMNVAPTRAFTSGSQRSILPALSSTILRQATVTGEKLIVLTIESPALQEAQLVHRGWTNFFDSRSDSPVLLKSPQDRLGTVKLNCAEILGTADDANERALFEVRANLWFSPAGTDCGIHNQHDFIEVHTQVLGRGRMQKFMSDSHDTLYEDQLLSPGNTNPIPFCIGVGGTFHYPWHQYHADTDCVWLAVEYHRI